MAVEYLNLEEAIDLLDMPSDIEDEEKGRIELEKFKSINNSQYILYIK